MAHPENHQSSVVRYSDNRKHTMRLLTSLIRFFFALISIQQCHAFVFMMPSTTFSQLSSRSGDAILEVRIRKTVYSMSKNNNDDSNGDNFDEFLDKPFFDPDKFDKSDSTGPLAWFANLIKSDYELAETLYAGGFFFVLVVITQELLRMQLYGDRYIPFTKLGAGGGGNLF